MFMIRTFVTQILLLFTITLCAQEYTIRFKHLSSKEGLSQSWVKCIIQNSSGFIWLGTADGLNKYDGYEFIVYKPESNNDRSIGNVYINDMVIKDKDDFYIATDQGIFIYHAKTDAFSKLPFLKLQVINCILPDNENSIWFGTNEGLYKYNETDSSVLSYFHDPVRFKQVMTNLLNNAIKYTDKGYIKFGYEIMDKLIQFYVSDSGIGISESDVEHIFNPFYKVENADSKLYQGAGIGLSITKNLVELMGGYIWVESEQEKGTTFYFVLPLAEKNTKDKEPKIKKKQQYNFEKTTVLVAEDDETNYSLIKMILKRTSAKLIRAADGQKAVEFIENNKEIQGCIVLMDIKMPNMNGVEAMKRIKKINNKIPVIAVTAYVQATDKSKFLKYKFDDYISKPIYAEKLLKLIDKYYNII